MTILGVDLSSNNAVFDFNLAYQQGVRACYVKAGGDNIPRYVSASYAGRVDAARAAGMIVGHYWVTGKHDPEVAAAFFVRNLRNVQPGDFFVLDNEKLDDGNFYSDDEAARWIRTVQSLVGGDPRRVFMYASGSPMKSSSWAGTRATGCQALVAWYDIAPWGFPQPLGSWPADQIGGHQYTSSANLGNGGRIDANSFKDNAFTFTNNPNTPEDDVPNIYEIIAGKTDTSGSHYLSINRAMRYPLGKQSEADYQYFMKNQLGYTDAQVAVRLVDTLESFGPVVKDAAPAAVTASSGAAVDYDKLAAAIVAKLPVGQSLTAGQVVDELAKRITS